MTYRRAAARNGQLQTRQARSQIDRHLREQAQPLWCGAGVVGAEMKTYIAFAHALSFSLLKNRRVSDPSSPDHHEKF
jgi:hypothetical protein